MPGSGGVLPSAALTLRIGGKVKRDFRSQTPGQAGEGSPCALDVPSIRGTVAEREDVMVRKGSGRRWRKRGGPAGGTMKELGVGTKRVEGGGELGRLAGTPLAGLITHPSRSLRSCAGPAEGAGGAGQSCRRAA